MALRAERGRPGVDKGLSGNKRSITMAKIAVQASKRRLNRRAYSRTGPLLDVRRFALPDRGARACCHDPDGSQEMHA